jgi:hypothetical protein
MKLSASVIARFHRYAKPGQPNACWEWQGCLDAHGYGQLSDKPNKTVLKAHRIAYFMAKGKIPKGRGICHDCDNPKCINPDHLYAGTQGDNFSDMLARGRHSPPPHKYGKYHGQARLSEKQVLTIRKSLLSGAALARKFQMSQSTISAIRNRKIWKHLP